MAQKVADYVIARMHQWGVRQIYGFPGDGISGLMGALHRSEERVRFIQVRHEELAAFMACGHAKFSGEVGVCMATSGPGAIHLLNGLYDAALDHMPVVAIVGQQATTAIGANYQQEVDLLSLFKDVAHQYVQMCSVPEQARQLVDRAFRIAIAERCVTCLIFPIDVQERPFEPPPRTHGATFTGVGYSAPRVLPQTADLERAAEILNAGQRVAMLVGAGALHAAEEVEEVADVLGAGVAKALLGKAVLPDDLPWVTGSIGLLGTRPSHVLMRDCDTLLMIGSTFPFAEWLPNEGDARGVQIDISPRSLGLRYPMEVNLCGDSRETLRALLPLLSRKDERSWRAKIEKEVDKWWKVLDERAHTKASPINPQLVFWELSPRLPDNCILTADAGTSANWFARDLKIRSGMMASLSGNLASMGPGVPYALAAKYVHPDRPVIAAVGDGAMQMIGNNALISVARDWPQWDDPRLIVLVLNNGDLNLVTWEQRVMTGDPKLVAAQRVPPFSYADYAEMLGLKGIKMEHESHVAAGWEQALAADRPVVVEAMTDPEVPPLPPHITAEQAKNYMFSMLYDPNRWQALKQSMKDFGHSLRPGRGRGRDER